MLNVLIWMAKALLLQFLIFALLGTIITMIYIFKELIEVIKDERK